MSIDYGPLSHIYAAIKRMKLIAFKIQLRLVSRYKVNHHASYARTLHYQAFGDFQLLIETGLVCCTINLYSLVITKKKNNLPQIHNNEREKKRSM